MKLRVLGCSGGIGAHGKTTSFLVDDDVLIDAGSGIDQLTIEELVRVDRVFLTHSHLDHICNLPMMIDSVGALRRSPIKIHALPETISALREHIFNWVIWPDFTEIPEFDRPYMQFEPIAVGTAVQIKNKWIKAIPANHTVAAVGYAMVSEQGSLVFSGDTSPDEPFWQAVNSTPNLKGLIIETAFANRDQDVARLSKHLFPIQLGRELEKLRVDAQVYITHLKPADESLTAKEISDWAGRHEPIVLKPGQVIEIS